MLVAEGALVLKFWFHLSKARAEEALQGAAGRARRRAGAWRAGDWEHFKHYDEFVDVCEDALRETSTGEAPWHVIEGSDPEYRSLTAGKLLLDALDARLKGAAPKASPRRPRRRRRPSTERNVLNSLDYARALKPKVYDKRLETAQARLNQLTRHRKMQRALAGDGLRGHGRRRQGQHDPAHDRAPWTRATTASSRSPRPPTRSARSPTCGASGGTSRGHGQGGDLRPLVVRAGAGRARRGLLLGRRLDARLPRDQRLRGAARRRAARSWPSSGWPITPEEQLRRFKEREKIAYKRFKITDEDWRNRKKWPHYERAVCDMVERTSTEVAPVESDRRQRQAARARDGHREALRPHRVAAVRRG